MEDACQYGHGIHPSLEILLIPEPDALFQMVGSDQIEFQWVIHCIKKLKFNLV